MASDGKTVLVTGGGGYVGAVLVPKLLAGGLPGARHRSVPLRRGRAAEAPAARADQGRPARSGGGEEEPPGRRRGDPPRLHLERPQLRAEPHPEPLHQLRLLRAAGGGVAPGGGAALHLRLHLERVRGERRARRHRGPPARPPHRLQQVQGHVRAHPAPVPGPRVHHRDHPARHRLRVLAPAAARPHREHPHQPRGEPAAHHHLRRRPEAAEHPHRGHHRPLRGAPDHARGA